MRAAAEAVAHWAPDVLVVASPHTVMYSDYFLTSLAERPRLSVYRSENNIYAQIIDDVAGHTLCSASSVEKGFEGRCV